jgi:hypothetical protein
MIAELARACNTRMVGSGVRVLYDDERFDASSAQRTHVRMREAGTDRITAAGAKGHDLRATLAAEEQLEAVVYVQSTQPGAKVSRHRELAREVGYSLTMTLLEELHARRVLFIDAAGQYVETDDAQPSHAAYRLTVTYRRGVQRQPFQAADSPVADLTTNVTIDGVTVEPNC